MILANAASMAADSNYSSMLGNHEAWRIAHELNSNNNNSNQLLRSSERSYAASLTTTEERVNTIIDCKYCKKYKRTKPHPPKVPVEKCMFNKNHISFRFAPVCKAMKLEYIPADKFKGDKASWPKHKKKDETKETTTND